MTANCGFGGVMVRSPATEESSMRHAQLLALPLAALVLVGATAAASMTPRSVK
jgi:hypothetical protein